MITAANSGSTASTRPRWSSTEAPRQAEATVAPSFRQSNGPQNNRTSRSPFRRSHRSSDGIHLEFTAGPAKGVTVYAVLADDSDRSSVARGENAGRTLDHVAVARSLVRVTDLQPTPLDKTTILALPRDDANQHLRVVLFARENKNGHIVGVTAREL